MRKRVLGFVCTSLLLAPLGARAQTTAFSDAKVQAPELAAPSRGSLVGQYASVAFGPGDVSRGAFSLPLPITLPGDRGAIGASPVPSYSPDSGISEWGVGWSASLAIYRTRVAGDIDYQSDDRTGPWGRMVKGTDGAWYPVGLKSLVRVEESGDELVANLPNGERWSFGLEARTSTPAGTFAWHLRRVTTITGHVTELLYTSNASGRPYLSKVHYGGTNPADPQYELAFDYDTLTVPFSDYRSGKPILLDRRIKAVHVATKGTSGFVERHRYALGYTQETGSPTFYLTSIQQTFAAGETAPAVHYTYSLARDYFAQAAAQRVPKLDPVLAQYGQDAFTPVQSSAVDADLDGRPDLELASDGRLLRQTDSGYEVEQLPAAAPGANPLCRPAPSRYNSPRLLARMEAHATETSVVALSSTGTHATTSLLICDRPGNPLWTTNLTGDWTLGPMTRMVDLTRDHAPDLIRVYPGGYDAMPNKSTPGAYAFGAVKSGTLTPRIQPDALWIHDFNGDGIGDLIERAQGSIVVWMGQGNLTFDPQGKVYPVRTAGGATLASLASYQLVFFDSNNDGVTDLLITDGSSISLFANNGTYFGGVTVPVFQGVGWRGIRPLVLDLAGNGNTELAYQKAGQAYAVDLDAPGVGLLAAADDGRGTVAQFTYKRAAPEVGVRYRNSLLAGVQLTSTGNSPVAYEYSYGKPDLHSLGRFLLGYESVTRRGALDGATMSFLNADAYAGVMLSSIERDDLTPSVEKVDLRTYDDAVARGVPWKRVKTIASGWRSTDAAHPAASLTTTEYLQYANDVCPVSKRTTTSAGALLETDTLSALPAFSHALSCLEASTVVSGAHADPTLDFRHEARFSRSAVGLLTGLDLVDAQGGTLALQRTSYTADGLVETITNAGHGTTTYDYAAGTRLLLGVTTPDGVRRSATRDGMHDALLSLTTNRGALQYTESFRYDGRERLAKQWDGLGAASEAKPDARYTYRDAALAMPGMVETDTLIDPAASAYARAVELLSAKGEPLAKTHKIPEGWAFDALLSRNASQRQTSSYARAATAADVSTLDVSALLGGAQVLTTSQLALSGDPVLGTQRFHADVQRSTASTLALAGGLSRTDVENGALTTATTRDEAQHVTTVRDQAGALTRYTYDALGRLRGVQLADGTRHRVSYDPLGRTSTITRDGIGTVTYSYEPTTGLLAEKIFGAPGKPRVRSVSFSYDAIGRVSAETDTDAVTGARQMFVNSYDGATPAGAASGSRGLLTAVVGPEYTKTLIYRADGKPTQTTVTVSGQRTIVTDLTYAEDGAPQDRTVTIRDGAGALLSRTRETVKRDAYGRDAELDVDGAPLMSLAYDVNGLPLWATFAAPVGNGEVVTLARDPVTRARIGMNQNAGAWTAAISGRMNARGLVDREDLSVGGVSRARQYIYSPQGFVSQASDADASYAYAYDLTGLPTRIASTAGGVTDTRALTRSGDVLSAGTHHERFDALGRAIEVDDTRIAYAPSGQIDQAQRGTTTWRYVYDESGHRVAKLTGGQIAALYLPDGSTVSGTSRTETVRFANVAVGVLRHDLGGAGAKHFKLVALDARGTALSDAEGAHRPASPFGDRVAHPDVAAAVDFASSAYDADLGLVRMGVRDYDAHLSRFTTPDPLYLEQPDRCLGGGPDCTLYAYARNNPITFLDLGGMQTAPTPTDAPGVSVGLNVTYGYGYGAAGLGMSAESGLAYSDGRPLTTYDSQGGSVLGLDTVRSKVGLEAGYALGITSYFHASDMDGASRTYSITLGVGTLSFVTSPADGRFTGWGLAVGPKAGLSYGVQDSVAHMHAWAPPETAATAAAPTTPPATVLAPPAPPSTPMFRMVPPAPSGADTPPGPWRDPPAPEAAAAAPAAPEQLSSPAGGTCGPTQ